MNTIQVYPDLDRLAKHASMRILEIGQQAIGSRGIFSFVLSGGSTPQPVYKRLGRARDSLDWSKVHVFWGDERCLPPEDPQSNYGMARESLLAQVPIPDDNVHRIKGELPPVEAAEDYQHRIAITFKNHPGLAWCETSDGVIPSFDLILLGMGSDGHTASLFPGSFAMQETLRWVVGVTHYQPPPPEVDRVTFTLPLISAAANVIFLVSGEGKARCLEQVLVDDGEHALPAQRVRPLSGRLEWMVDRPAASRLSGSEARSA
jgi:6-phosphogluconolactonase